MKPITLILAFILLLMMACSPSTQITASWKNEQESRQPYSSILLASFSEDLSLRQSLEGEFMSRLQNRDVTAIRSIDVFTPDFFSTNEPNEDQVLEILNEVNAEAIMTITLINVEEDERFVPGGGMGPMFAPMGRFGYYGNFFGYWNHWNAAGWNQGYYTTDRRYFMETNLYDAESLKLIWSAQSKTLNPSDIQAFAKEYVDAIKAEMREENLIL
ncbi:hypothetical protein [Arthrospiribacter ruber]|uniref:DUF4136 domain-containing protein n=1 Tax=Arthrospiribacter ruber TaxID=2487934 RepID=A0A951MDB9_9BACT|nr:hypothetical protein [Arthrospiribacter ruber]MBW3467181.1 hypothetical protein [Arthrospiribacter ruber]